MNNKHFIQSTMACIYRTTVLFLFILFFISCKQQEVEKVVIWSDCSEVAQYIELFNSTHSETKAILVYKENPALSLPVQKNELPPDIIIGSWLQGDETIKYFKSINYLFDRSLLTTSIFYPQLIDSGKNENNYILLPVSFNLPAIIFSDKNKDLITDAYTLTIEQIREIAASYNKKNKKGAYTQIGFLPSTNEDFLYLSAKLNDCNFREEKNKIIWNEENLYKTIDYIKEWVNTENTSAQTEEDFAFKYLFMSDYRQISSNNTLFAYITSDRLFKIMHEDHQQIDYRWIRNDSKIPIEDSYKMLGIYRDSQNQVGATEFITWFFNSQNQEDMLKRKNNLNLDTELFGIAGGFSSLRDVTEHIIPVYYNQLLTNLPPQNLLATPQKLPARWNSYKTAVIQPFLKGSVTATENQAAPAIQDLESEWRKKIFD